MELVSRRQPWDALWAETAKYYLPTSMSWNTDGKSRTALVRGTRVFDDTASWAACRFAAALLGMVMNPAESWLQFDLYTDQDGLEVETRRYLDKLRDIVMFMLQAPEVGFYDAYHEHLLDYGIFGEAVLLIDRNPDTLLPRFTPYPLEQCYVGMGARRFPNTVFRKYEMTAQAIVDEFAAKDDTIPPLIEKAISKEQYLDKFTVIHGVFPRKHGIAGGFATNKPWASVYYLEQDKTMIRESGFDQFPFSVPRFMLFASEDHGQGPGTLSLTNVRTLNTIIKTLLTSDQRIAAPAYLAKHRGWIKPLNFTPSYVNYYDGMDDLDKALHPIGNEGQPQAGREWVQDLRDFITRAFYLDRLMAPEKKAEVKEIEMQMGSEERMRDLIPQLSRLHAESISNIIMNVMPIAMELLKEPPPPELQGQIIRLKYLSPLAKAQHSLEISTANRTMQQIIIPMAQIEPTVTKTIDWYKFTQWNLNKAGFPAEVRKTEEEFRADEQAEQQKANMAAGLGAAEQASKVAMNMSKAHTAAPALGGYI